MGRRVKNVLVFHRSMTFLSGKKFLKLEIETMAKNMAMRCAAEKIGFKLEG